ncbi:helix-turn-helix transcriptional regulator [Herbiconiux solani]|uniref:helix-turn-helix transcriptional regulator n=1 Tax=Herbiconiux solani TaxID=661329 RepID=UPI000824A6A5|nr:LuxR family transcriptional regulator [Herbiconiux solani]
MLERRARAWSRTVRQALDAGDVEAAAALVRDEWSALVTTDPSCVRETIQALPDSLWQADAWLLLGLASSSYGSPDSVERAGATLFLKESQRLVALGRPPGVSAEIELMTRFGFAKHQRSIGRFDRAAAELDELTTALALTDDVPFEWRLAMDARLQLELSLVDWHRAGFDTGDSSIGPALALAEDSLYPEEQVAAYGLAGLQAVIAENPERADLWFDRALAAAEATELGSDPSEIPLAESTAMAPALFAHALTLLDRGRLDAAGEVVPLLERLSTGSEWRAYTAVFTATRLLLLRRYTDALESLRLARQLSRKWEDAILLDALSYGVRLGIEIGLRRPHAVDPVAGRTTDARHVFCSGRYLGWLQLSQGQYQEAIEEIEECIRLGDGHARGTLIDVLLIDTTARAALGDAVGSATSLDYALALGAESGIRRAFLHLPLAQLVPLLASARTRPQPAAVVALLDELGATFESAAEPVLRLSEREHQILVALGEGRTARELSQELFISPNTMKTHLRHIYRKLGVASRDEAIQMGHRLGITHRSPSI